MHINPHIQCLPLHDCLDFDNRLLRAQLSPLLANTATLKVNRVSCVLSWVRTDVVEYIPVVIDPRG